MKNTTKRILATASAVAVMGSMASLVNAEGNEIYINNGLVPNNEVKEIEGTKFIPLRAICETLEFEVNWDGDQRKIEIVKLPVYITCSPDRDGYTFARTAPMMLGTAPKLINDLTYVPLNFIDEILQAEYTEENSNIYISYGQETNKVSGTVLEVITENEKPVQLIIGDAEDVENQVALNLDEAMQEKAIELGISEGSAIIAETSDTATMSIPPQYTVASLELEVKDANTLGGKVLELVYEEDKLVQLIIGEADDVNTQAAFNLTEEIAQKVIADEIKVGDTVLIETTDIATMSIPPQYIATSVTKTEINTVEITGTVCDLVEEDGKLIQIVIGDKDDVHSQTVFNLSDVDTAYENGIEIGTSITVTATEQKTKSLPAQMTAITIAINK